MPIGVIDACLKPEITMQDATFPVADVDMMCMDCDRPLPVGAPYAERLVSMMDDTAVCELVCVYCGMSS